ncbi:50S ribosomal protein L13 [Candidatus Dojkabacteria bacterium]|nr:50S ribosomal protein L13 [Candidatus Dojkabacteria bacterium]
MKTRAIKASEIKEEWYLLDASAKRLGRLASKAASLLLGKENPINDSSLTPKVKVIIINSTKVDIHPRKKIRKKYYRHSGYVGNLKEISYKKMSESQPNKIIELAVKGMVPRNKHHKKIMGNLFVYEDDQTDKHKAQKPKEVEIK